MITTTTSTNSSSNSSSSTNSTVQSLVSNSDAVSGVAVTNVQSAVANVLVSVPTPKEKPKYSVFSTTAHSAIDTKFEGKTAEAFSEVYAKIVEMVERDPALDPDRHEDPFKPGKRRIWFTNFSDRYVFYYNEHKEKIQVPFSELTFGLGEDASEDKQKAVREEFGELMDQACDILQSAGRLGAPSREGAYGSSSQFNARATQTLQIMSMGSKDKTILPRTTSADTIDKLVKARYLQIDQDSSLSDKQKAERKQAILDRKAQLEAQLKKAKTDLDAYSKTDQEKPFWKNLKNRYDAFDMFAATAAVIMAPLPEEITDAKNKNDDGVHSKKEKEKLKAEWANAAQATLCRHVLTDALIDVKNGDGVYDKRANWKKKMGAPFRKIKEKVVKKYEDKDITEAERQYIDRTAELLTKEKLDSLEWQLARKVVDKEHHIRWTEMVGPLTEEDLKNTEY